MRSGPVGSGQQRDRSRDAGGRFPLPGLHGTGRRQQELPPGPNGLRDGRANGTGHASPAVTRTHKRRPPSRATTLSGTDPTQGGVLIRAGQPHRPGAGTRKAGRQPVTRCFNGRRRPAGPHNPDGNLRSHADARPAPRSAPRDPAPAAWPRRSGRAPGTRYRSHVARFRGQQLIQLRIGPAGAAGVFRGQPCQLPGARAARDGPQTAPCTPRSGLTPAVRPAHRPARR